jgi:hypothetical protein
LKLSKRVGAVSFAAESDATWKIQTIDAALLGTDTAPLQIGMRFANDVFTGKYDDDATLITPTLAAELVSVGGLKGEFEVPATLKFLTLRTGSSPTGSQATHAPTGYVRA